ncbi:5'-methylthioadenosine/S-adenosylhomocysteine nucleosidase [Suicoccus acidiformans]|uniref:5'-methylthioadenosine/S-adenosylhomocysteine nucleosidase n=1 Tax=Suicoccus acidiformans TaxID=2036206 RepID=A0A347WLK2_9LACT|nr:5'-methylthioadenosine/adenosylhomocysteine nucleosidase [Suicoccus acidiformans]AXY25959.1 5'-methylthioadenosine/S-adenosylhomocysteine nucleosidase [Suicoccus acidiformans]
MKIGIIGAMEEEIRVLKTRIHDVDIVRYQNIDHYVGRIGEHEVVLVESGIGKVNATISVTLLKEHFNVDAIINSGSAGAIDAGLKVGDIVIAHSLSYHDVDVTGFGYQLGQMAGMPEAYYSDTELMRTAQAACRQAGVEPILGLIVSGDQFIDSQEEIQRIQASFPKARACEMESTAIAQACHQLGLPFVIIRAISDQADGDAPMTFDEFILMVGKVTSDIVFRTIELA